MYIIIITIHLQDNCGESNTEQDCGSGIDDVSITDSTRFIALLTIIIIIYTKVSNNIKL